MPRPLLRVPRLAGASIERQQRLLKLADDVLAKDLAVMLSGLLVSVDGTHVELRHELLANERAFTEQRLVVAVDLFQEAGFAVQRNGRRSQQYQSGLFFDFDNAGILYRLVPDRSLHEHVQQHITRMCKAESLRLLSHHAVQLRWISDATGNGYHRDFGLLFARRSQHCGTTAVAVQCQLRSE